MVGSINSSGTSSYSESLLDVLRSVSENPLNLVTIILDAVIVLFLLYCFNNIR